jgi:hypothetical protein
MRGAVPPFSLRRHGVMLNKTQEQFYLYLFDYSIEGFLGRYEGLLLSACR